jgi:hypothetical protein
MLPSHWYMHLTVILASTVSADEASDAIWTLLYQIIACVLLLLSCAIRAFRHVLVLLAETQHVQTKVPEVETWMVS